ncbi:MAG: ComF family protein [Bacteroidaceae bacterium]|nr:ComF family protein [Bacteroidaceae bacterium]
MKRIKEWGISLKDWLFPHYCNICGNRLPKEGQVLCQSCLSKMPRTKYHTWPDNRMARQFWGKFPMERAAAWFFYSQGSSYAHIIHLFKYKGRKQLAIDVGRMMAIEMLSSGFFEGIDCIIPVPLHNKRQRERGYNQSELLAYGVSSVTHIPVVCDAVERIRYTETQTQRSSKERFENMQNVFRSRKGEPLVGKHILLVDDVMTTSATLTACADALQVVPGIRVSFLTVAIADH